MKLLMLPHYKDLGLDNGVGQVLYHYHKYLPKMGIEVVTNPKQKYDLSMGHLGHLPNADIFASHGFWWGDSISDNKRQQNQQLAQCAVNARAVIVPSNYVAESFRREFRIASYVIPHGIDIEKWRHNHKNGGYVLWNKNRQSDVCNPQAVYELAKRFTKLPFISTYCNEKLDNITVTGRLPFEKMKPLVQKTNIYLSTARETFGIGILEALASGVPVLGFNWGGNTDLITHKVDGYLVKPNDYNGLVKGLEWLLQNRDKLTENCIKKASNYTWLNVAEKIKGVCKDVFEKMLVL